MQDHKGGANLSWKRALRFQEGHRGLYAAHYFHSDDCVFRYNHYYFIPSELLKSGDV